MLALGALLALVVSVASRGASAEDTGADATIEVVVRGSTASGYTSRASADTALREALDTAAPISPTPAGRAGRPGYRSVKVIG
jgi:hypothetical protein